MKPKLWGGRETDGAVAASGQVSRADEDAMLVGRAPGKARRAFFDYIKEVFSGTLGVANPIKPE